MAASAADAGGAAHGSAAAATTARSGSAVASDGEEEARINSEELRHPEGEVERLAGVQPRVARRRVAVVEVALEDLLGPAQALGDVVARQLDVDAARPRALVAVHGEERAQLGEDVVEAAGLAAALAGERVAVHGVAGPHHRVALGLDGPDERREQLLDPVRPEPGDEGQPARQAVRVQAVAQRHDLVGRAVRADLAADRVADAREELDVRAVELAGAVADPHQVGRAVVPVAGQRVHAGQAFLVGEDQRLVARPEVDLVQALLGAEVDAAGGHEAQGAVDLRRDALVALALGRRRHELLVPQVHLGQVGEAALGEGAQQVERRGRLLVRRDQAVGIRARALRPRTPRR